MRAETVENQVKEYSMFSKLGWSPAAIAISNLQKSGYTINKWTAVIILMPFSLIWPMFALLLPNIKQINFNSIQKRVMNGYVLLQQILKKSHETLIMFHDSLDINISFTLVGHAKFDLFRELLHHSPNNLHLSSGK